MTDPFHEPLRFWLSGTRAAQADIGQRIDYFVTGEEAVLPYRTATGRNLIVRTSTHNETVMLFNGGNGAEHLPKWPWTLLLDNLPMQGGGGIKYPFVFSGDHHE